MIIYLRCTTFLTYHKYSQLLTTLMEAEWEQFLECFFKSSFPSYFFYAMTLNLFLNNS